MGKNSIEYKLNLNEKGFVSGAKNAGKTFDLELRKMQKSAVDLKSATKQAGAELKTLDKIKILQGAQNDFKELNNQFTEAKRNTRALAKEAKTGGAQQKKAYREAKEEVTRLSVAIREQKKNLGEQSSGLKKIGVETKSLTSEQKRLNSEYKVSQTQVSKLTAEYKKAEKEVNNVLKTQNSFAKLGIKSTRELKAEIALLQRSEKAIAKSSKSSAKDRLRAQEALRKKIKEVRAEIDGTAKATSGMGGGMKSLLGPIAALASGAAALAASVSALKTFAEFDDTMRTVGAVSNATAQEMADLTEIAKRMGAETRFSASEAAQGLQFMGMAGFTAQQQIDALPDVLNLAAAGQLALADASDIATNILTGYGLQVSDLAMVNDVLAKTFVSSNTNLQELGNAFSYVGPIAKSAGQGFTETASALGLFANAGIKGERGGTALRGIIKSLLAPTSKASAVFETLGIKVKDTSGELKPITQLMKEFGSAGATTAQMMIAFGRHGSAMASAVGQGAEQIDKMVATVNDFGGTTSRVAKQMEAGIGGQLRALKSAFEALKIATGEAIAKELAGEFKDLTEYMRENSGVVAEMLAGLIKAAGGFIQGGLAIAKFIAHNQELVKTIALVTAGAALYLKGLLAVKLITLATAGSTATLAATLGKAGLAGVLVFTTTMILSANKAFWEMKAAQDESAAAAERAEAANAKYQDRLSRASEAVGRTITDWKDLQEAYKKGELDYDSATDTYLKGEGAKTVATRKFKAEQESLSKTQEQLAENDKKNIEKVMNLYGRLPAEVGAAIAEVNKTYETIPEATGKALGEAQKEWKKLSDAIGDYEDKLSEAQQGTADAMFELAQAGRSPIEQWNAQRDAAKNLQAAVRGALVAAQEYAAAGDLEKANKAWERAADLGKKAQSAFKSLAHAVKAEFAPAQQEALDSAKKSLKEYGDEAKKQFKKYEDAAGKVVDITDKITGRTDSLNEKIREFGRESMAPAAAWRDMKAEADTYQAAAERAVAAGDFDRAIELLDKASSKYEELNGEVKDGERIAISADAARAASLAGLKSSQQAAIAALEAKNKAEMAAGEAALKAGLAAEAAKEKEAAKIAKLEAQKTENVKSAAAAAITAQDGVASSGKLVEESIGRQLDASKELADEINKNAGFGLGEMYTEAGSEAKKLNELQKTHNQLINGAGIEWGKAWSTMGKGSGSAFEAVNKEITASEARMKVLAQDRKVKMIIEEVRGASGGASVGTVYGASGGASVSFRDGSGGLSLPGWGGGDRAANAFYLENGEDVMDKYTVSDVGRDTLRDMRAGRYIRAAQKMVDRFLPVGGLDRIRIEPRPIAAPAAQLASQAGDNTPNLGTITLQVGQISVEASMPVDHAALVQAEINRQQNIAKRSRGRG